MFYLLFSRFLPTINLTLLPIKPNSGHSREADGNERGAASGHLIGPHRAHRQAHRIRTRTTEQGEEQTHGGVRHQAEVDGADDRGAEGDAAGARRDRSSGIVGGVQRLRNHRKSERKRRDIFFLSFSPPAAFSFPPSHPLPNSRLPNNFSRARRSRGRSTVF